jgi:acetate kinase
MKILVVNCGSSSLKYQLIDTDTDKILAKGRCDRIGAREGEIGSPFIEYKGPDGKKVIEELPLRDHVEAFENVVRYLTNPEIGAVKDLSEVSAIGHRIVNGGPFFKESTLVTDEVLKTFKEKSIPYAPLHNPAALQGIDACLKTMPGIPEVLVFDTTFHQTMPEKAYMYAIPREYYDKYGIRRYGAHGMSHQYVTEEASRLTKIPQDKLNMISCHLGNGSSITAVKNGKCVDTSMGFTPLEGLAMGTRSGDLDPAILEFLMERENITINEMLQILNKKSGLLAVSGQTGDVRDLRKLRDEGNERAKLALDILCYRVRKYIGAYMAVLGHVDCITFEGGIGEHNPDVVRACVEGLEEYGIVLEPSYKDSEQYEGIISAPESRIKMYVIATNEEEIIAKEAMRLVK